MKLLPHLVICPACRGNPTSNLFISGKDSEIIQLTCPYCAGLGAISPDQSGWAAIGCRLKMARLSTKVGVVYEQGRKCMTLRADVPLESMPLDMQAFHYRISPASLAMIELGEMDPSIIAPWVDKSSLSFPE